MLQSRFTSISHVYLSKSYVSLRHLDEIEKKANPSTYCDRSIETKKARILHSFSFLQILSISFKTLIKSHTLSLSFLYEYILVESINYSSQFSYSRSSWHTRETLTCTRLSYLGSNDSVFFPFRFIRIHFVEKLIIMVRRFRWLAKETILSIGMFF